MNETLKRAIFGAVYVAIMWIGASYSEASCRFLFSVLGIVSVYEMWKLRKGRSKFIAYLYVLLPFTLIQLLISDFQVDNIPFNSSLILSMFVFTWTFDTFAYLFGVKFVFSSFFNYHYFPITRGVYYSFFFFKISFRNSKEIDRHNK